MRRGNGGNNFQTTNKHLQLTSYGTNLKMGRYSSSGKRYPAALDNIHP
jgi:hypothetical protein